MSTAREHAEWLSLVPVSGPFLSMPVLLQAFPQGLDAHDPDHARSLRQEYANWQNNIESRRANPAAHRHWIMFVLNQTLELDDRVLVEGQAIPQSLQVEIPERHELIRPSFAVLDAQSRKPRLLIQSYPSAQELSGQIPGSTWKASPETRMAELLHSTGVRLGLLTNGEHWMLVDAPKDGTTGFASWYASLWLEEPLTLRAFRSLLCASRFFNSKETSTLEALLAESASNQQEVTDQLGYQVRKAVEVLIHSLDKADQDFGRSLLADVPEEILYESALTVMMRLVFLFCAEERDLIPSKPFPVYEDNYSVSSISKQLRELADKHTEELLERRYDAWPRLLAAFRAIHGGLNHSEVYIPAYGGSLFNPDRFPFLEGRKSRTSWRDTEATPLPVNNRTVLHLLEALQLLQIRLTGGGGTEARRVSFRALDIEQIGHVYEGLLDHTAKRSKEPFLGLAGTRAKESEISLTELEKEAAKGEDSLIKYLAEETGRSVAALKKAIGSTPEDATQAKLRTACNGDENLLKRVLPFASLIRTDHFGYPIVIPTGSVFVTAGTDRRSSGTHYTPRSLTEPIVRYTLEPLVYVGPAEGKPKDQWTLKPAKELLELKICDMACGSGAFLVQAARYMAERLLEAWDDAKKDHPNTPGITPEGTPSTGSSHETLIPNEPAERKTYAMRIIAQRCLYGVDINPLAVEMAKLSLWLLTLAKDKPFEFLDHSIRCGDSLVGIHAISQLKNYSLKETSKTTFQWPADFEEPVESALNLRLMLESLPTNTVDDVRRQEDLLREANDRMARLKCAADLLVAAEFWCENAKDKGERLNHATIRTGHYMVQGSVEEFEQVAAKERQGQKMFHWPLEFPEVIVKRGGFDAFVGNPPFVGGRRIIRTFGEPYQRGLQSLFPFISANADYCTFFFHRAYQETRIPGFFSYLATKTISEGDTRESGLDLLTDEGAAIFRAYTSLPWPGSASVLISLIFIARHGWHCEAALNDASVPAISNSLTGTLSTGEESAYHLASRQSQVFQGCAVAGDGFLLTESEAEKLLAASPANSEIVRQYITGSTFCNNPDYRPTGWIIHFFDRSEDQAKKFKECFAIVEGKVKPYRMGVRRDAHRRYWWQFGDKRPAMFKAVGGLSRVLANARVAKFIAFDFLPTDLVYLNTLHIFPFDDSGHLALLQSTFHEAWALARISSVGVTPQYTPVDCFGTFPFPASSQVEVLNSIGSKYRSHRQSVMLENRYGLTEIYNRFHDPDETSADIQKLRDVHVEMDQAVAAAYGWGDLELDHGFHETKQGVRFTIREPARREVLQRLLKLNHERYAEEVKQGLHDKKGGAKKTASKNKASKIQETEPSLFDLKE